MKMAVSDNDRYIVQVFVGSLSQHYEALSVEASKQTTSAEIVSCIVEQLSLGEPGGNYELAEVIGYKLGQECKERRLGPLESPVAVMLLWPKNSQEYYRFCLREKLNDSLWENSFAMDPQLIKDYFQRFLYQPQDREYPDLCQLPDLNEQTLLENLRARFLANHIYTYVGSILIAVNPFKFHPIYNPKYVKLYQNRRLGNELPPHIFAVADAAYHCMLRERRNQCVVISGESGSGKTESTNFLLHHLTALSQKGSHGSGVEQTILSAGPVLEAFGNAKTAHNNNSSRFGKFIQVNYKENGMVHGAVVQKYLLEKSRICSQGRNERNYHVFYYLLAGASDLERQLLHLMRSDQYYYLNRSGCYTLDNVDEKYEFFRLKQSMEMVGFTAEKQRRLFAVLSAVLLLGNVEFQPRKSAYHHDESVAVKNPGVVSLISDLLKVKQETLMAALTAKRARASGETLIINYRLPEAVAARDTIAKCLYGSLFDWIVLQVNHALLSKKDTLRDHQGNSIGVLDIFGFEDFGLCNSFEQFCINYANEHLQYYFNQHVFKYEQEEYRKEGIRWTDIDFMDNTGCLQLIEGKPNGLLCVLDDQCNFPGATNETLLQKFNSVHKDNVFYEIPQKREAAFIVRHYAGKVKYQVLEMREKNLDLMRQDIVGVLKNSNMAFVRELVGADPVAVFRWAIVRAFFRAFFAFNEAGKRHRLGRADGSKTSYIHQRYRNHTPNENLISLKLGCEKDKRFVGGSTATNKKLVVTTTNEHTPLNNRSNRVKWPNEANKTDSKIVSPASKKDEDRVTGNGKRPLGTAPGCLERVMCHDEAEVMNRANQIVMKSKSFRPRERGKKGLKNLQTVKTLAGRTQSHGQQPGKARKQPLTVTAQFQHSLHSLMDTLNQANPFFIRCIKSNSDKIPNKFDNETVQRQLRYTGMLETVRIRQAGYNVRLTYEEFIQLYRILLPRGLTSTQVDVRNFLLTLNLNRDNYQMGASKIFLRECEKLKLDYRLHQQIIAAIVAIQRCFRGILEQRKFQRMREAAITIQSYWRMVLSQRALNQLRCCAAASQIQRAWRGYQSATWFKRLRTNLVIFQAHARGYLLRSRLKARRQKEEGVPVSRESSQEEVEVEQQDSEGSGSGVQDDCELENIPPPEPRKRTSRPLSRQSRGDLLDVFLHESGDNIFQSGDNVDIAVRPLKRKQSPKRKARAKTETGGEEAPIECNERKDSCDSLISQRSSDSQSVAPVRDTLHRARKQIQALIGGGKKADSSVQTGLSDSETEEADANAQVPKGDAAAWKANLITQTHTHTHPVLSSYSSEPAPNNPPPLHHPLRRNIRDSHTMNQNAKYWRRGVVRTEGEEPDVPTRLIRKREQIGRGRAVTEEATDGKMRDDALTLAAAAAAALPIGDPSTPDSPTATGPALTVVSSSRPPVWVMRSSSGARASVEGVIPPSDGMPQITAHAAKRNRCSANPSSVSTFSPAELKRRNSDPATQTGTASSKTPLLSSDIVWKGTTMFTIADHSFRKLARFTKEDRCVSCNNPMDAIVTQGYKCSDCKQLFHTTCIQNGGVLLMPCPSPHPSGTGAPGGKPGRRKPRKPSRAQHESKAAVEGRFSLTGTSQFTDSTDKIISDARELQLMQDFITRKIFLMESEEGKKPSRVDRVFKQALREFKDNLVATYSVVNKQGSEGLNIKYKDLIANFLHVMQTVCTQEQTHEDFPVTMGVNAFRGFMNEFMSMTRVEGEKDKPGRKRKKDKDKKRRADEPIRHGGHTFVLTIINIPTACEICTSFFMWPIERGLVCQNCKLTCHKKCFSKASVECGKEAMGVDNIQEGLPVQRLTRNRVFGVPLHLLATGDGKVPLVVDRLITTIEMYGLYTEGIYRKSGVTSKVRELKARLEASGEDCGGSEDPVDFETYPVHVLAAVLKTFLRDMPEPLLTFDCYDDFLRAAMLTEPADRVSTLFAILKKLPKPNFDLMERLIFHLARVALHEDVNRMSASALAIVFAPCVLRTNKAVPAQDSLTDISRQTQCIETIIGEQLRKVRSTLADIDTLDEACHTATHRLSSLRSSKIFTAEELFVAEMSARERARHEEAMLMGHIQEMEKEKALLTSTLPSLTRASSDDDLLSTDMDDGSLDDAAEMDQDGRQSVYLENRVQKLQKLLRRAAGGSASGGSAPGGSAPGGMGGRQHGVGHSRRQASSGRMDASEAASEAAMRQSTSDTSVTSLYAAANDCDEDPIMV